MRYVVYDMEVFCADWIAVFKDIATGVRTVFHNDNEGLHDYMSQDDVLFVGFNNKHYDNYIVKTIACDWSPQEVKQLNDFIIGGGDGWEYPPLKDEYFRFASTDLFDDCQRGVSLKSIEAHLGLNIEETEVDFNIDRPLTQEELEKTVRYCSFDVDATEKLLEIRSDYLMAKINLGAMRGIDEATSAYCTNAKIVAKYLDAKPRDWKDGREYEYPSNLDVSVIPQKILDFFATIRDLSIPDNDLFTTFLEITLGDCPCKYAWGGVHGSQLAYHEESTDTRVIQNRDVSSLYPSLMLIYGYLSRNCPSPAVFQETYDERIEAKHKGDKKKATTLKLPLNTTSGAAENVYNDLYDPHSARSMRISGQLFLTELAMKLLNGCTTLKILNFNTDGIMYSVDKTELDIVDRICAEWEKTTRFELETDEIAKVWIKDVNNLLFVKTNGKVKTVGGYLNYGINLKGAWSINNNTTIVKDAVIAYFTKDIPLKDTIYACGTPLSFQLVAKAGSLYSGAFQIIDGEKVPTQRVNRVYATKNRRYGTLYRVHAKKGNDNKISGLPEHCIIDNRGKIDISEIDKDWYVKLAQKYVNDYLGKNRKVKRTNTRKINSIKKSILILLEE